MTRLGRARVAVSLVLLATGCRGQGDSKGGVVVHVSQDEPFAIDALDVTIAAAPDQVQHWHYLVPEQKVLPDTIGIVSNDDPSATVSVVVSAFVRDDAAASWVAVDRRDITLAVPSDHIADEYIVLSARCSAQVRTVDDGAVSLCTEANPDTTCDPQTGACVDAHVPPRISGAGDASLGEVNDDAAGGDTPGRTAPSCAEPGAGRDDCGPRRESCCKSLVVLHGSFSRSNDPAYPARVSDVNLDKFEITVGRFRSFTRAVVAGWRPAEGAGKHVHLNDGKGLAGDGKFEPGWSSAPEGAELPSTAAEWTNALSCEPTLRIESWSADPPDDRRPINCISWFEAQAFCIWDGGFLPSEAEWNNAAAAGLEQRAYPWSSPPMSVVIDPQYASYALDDMSECFGDGMSGCALTDLLEVGSRPKGNGRYGQSDLAGNAWEWIYDRFDDTYSVGTCVDCANVLTQGDRVVRGGGLGAPASELLNTFREQAAPATRRFYTGARCARPL